MSSEEVAISAQGLSKAYTLRHQAPRHTTLAEALLHRLRRPFGQETSETFWALNDVAFEIKKGEVVGIVGRNGAGKSTLLKLLSRITEPTRGQIDLYGRVGSLLEVGTGFHPELTGRENIYLNGGILGMTRREIDRQFDAIVDFAGIEQFLDTPVKRYSSGMYVRLAFAVAAHLETEILLVDEVLAVGDAEFQKKCLQKMRTVAQCGRTVLLVSHHMHSVSALCDRALFLEGGKITYDGDVIEAVRRYVKSFQDPSYAASDPQRRPGTGEVRFTSVTPGREFFTCEEAKEIHFTIESFRSQQAPVFISCHIVDAHGGVILQCDSRLNDHWVRVEDRYTGTFTIRTPWLKPGSYRVDMFLCSCGIIDQYEQACTLQVIPILPYPHSVGQEATAAGSVFADFSYASSSGDRRCQPPETEQLPDRIALVADGKSEV